MVAPRWSAICSSSAGSSGRELARLAAARVKDHDTAKLREVADRADHTTIAPELFDIDFAFYIELAHISGNQVMMLLLNTVRDGVRNFLPLIANLAGPQHGAIRHHQRALIAAVESGDIVAAGKISDDYLRMGEELAARMTGQLTQRPLLSADPTG